MNLGDNGVLFIAGMQKLGTRTRKIRRRMCSLQLFPKVLTPAGASGVLNSEVNDDDDAYAPLYSLSYFSDGPEASIGGCRMLSAVGEEVGKRRDLFLSNSETAVQRGGNFSASIEYSFE